MEICQALLFKPCCIDPPSVRIRIDEKIELLQSHFNPFLKKLLAFNETIVISTYIRRTSFQKMVTVTSSVQTLTALASQFQHFNGVQNELDPAPILPAGVCTKERAGKAAIILMKISRFDRMSKVKFSSCVALHRIRRSSYSTFQFLSILSKVLEAQQNVLGIHLSFL